MKIALELGKPDVACISDAVRMCRPQGENGLGLNDDIVSLVSGSALTILAKDGKQLVGVGAVTHSGDVHVYVLPSYDHRSVTDPITKLLSGKSKPVQA